MGGSVPLTPTLFNGSPVFKKLIYLGGKYNVKTNVEQPSENNFDFKTKKKLRRGRKGSYQFKTKYSGSTMICFYFQDRRDKA